MTEVTFRRAFADEPACLELIEELDSTMFQFYPKEHMYGLHSNEGRDPLLHFFVIYEGENIAGCGALRVLDSTTGELKRMYVRPAFRRRGISRLLINHLENTARAVGLTCMRLETGPEQVEALALYESSGYAYIPPYGEYIGSPVSVCMEKVLRAPAGRSC